MSALLDTLARAVGALGGKKVTAMLVAMVAWIGGRVGLDLPLDVVAVPIGVLVSYILAQGVADAGKERAKVETQAAIEHGVTTARVELTTIPPPVAMPPPTPGSTPTPALSLDEQAARLRQDAFTAKFRRPAPDATEDK